MLKKLLHQLAGTSGPSFVDGPDGAVSLRGKGFENRAKEK